MSDAMLKAAALLSNADLLARLQQLAARARDTTVEMVAHLAELEARGSYLAGGYGSLFDYCRFALRLSEHAAYNRVVAARVVRQFPSILAGLADGSLNLTTVRLVAPHLTAENHREMLARAAGRSKRETEALVASLAPQPDVAASIRKVPEPRAPLASGPMASVLETPPQERAVADAPPMEATPPAMADASALVDRPVATPSGPRSIVAALSPGRYRVQFTVDSETYEELQLLRDLLRREFPDGDPGAIFARGLKLLMAHVAKEKAGEVSGPVTGRSIARGSRHIPAAVKRAVWLRDRGQCAFVAKSGWRCTGRAFLELHHVHPFAHGGEPTVANISLRCRRHNVYESELVFGPRPAGEGTAPPIGLAGSHGR